MLIDNDIYKALEKTIDELGNKARLAHKLGFSQSTIKRWMDRSTFDLSANTWDKLYPTIKHNIPPSHKSHQFAPIQKKQLTQSSATQIMTQVTEAVPVSGLSIKEVPIIGLASAKGFEPAVDPVDQFITDNTIGSEPMALVNDVSFLVKVEGDSMSPKLPHGSLLLIDTTDSMPRRGNTVIARLSDVGVVVKKYNRKDNVIYLTSINPTGENYEIRIKEEPGRLVYLWKVKKAIVDLDQQQWEENRNGNH